MGSNKKGGQISTNSPELEAYTKKGKDSVNAWLAKYTLLLIGSGVATVKVEYSGQGDSGQIDDVSCFDAKGHRVDDPFGSPTVAKQFEDFLYDVLDVRGWDVNNEGSQGNMEWDLKADEFTHHHETNVTQVEVAEYEDASDLIGRVDPDNRG